MSAGDDDLRLLPLGRPRGDAFTIDFEGSAVRAFEGESVAAALIAGGVETLARSAKYHRPRGAFCLEGHCGSCALRIDGRPSVRACMTPVRPDLRCERQNAFPSAEIDVLEAADWMFPRGMDHHTLLTGNRVMNRILMKVVREMGGSGTLPDAPAASIPARAEELVDACIVGGGPAGLAAAAALARARPKARLLVVDEQLAPGGSWLAEPGGVRRARDAAARAAAAGVRVLSGATAIGFFPEDGNSDGDGSRDGDGRGDSHDGGSAGPRARADDRLPAVLDSAGPRARGDDRLPGVLAVAAAPGLIEVRARRILYATGAYDQNLPFLDNDRPGVRSARACGRLAFVHGISPGRRVAVVGESSYGDRLAAALTAAGVAVERVDPAREQPFAARGSSRVSGLVLEPAAPAAEGRGAAGRRRTVRADAIAVAATPAPASELARQHGADVRLDPARGGFAVPVDGDGHVVGADARVFACGDVTGYTGPDAAETAGAAAGAAVARTL